MVYIDKDTGYYSINYEFINQLTAVKLKQLQVEMSSLEKRLDKLENK